MPVSRWMRVVIASVATRSRGQSAAHERFCDARERLQVGFPSHEGHEIPFWLQYSEKMNVVHVSRTMRRWLLVVLTAGTGAGVLLTASAANATAHAHAWCTAEQLSLSVATQNHAQQGQAGGGDLWFLQLRRQGRSACLVGGWLTLSGARTATGLTLPVKPFYESIGIGRSVPPRWFALGRNGEAFEEMWTSSPMTYPAISACNHTAVRLTFTLPHSRGIAVSAAAILDHASLPSRKDRHRPDRHCIVVLRLLGAVRVGTQRARAY